MSKTYFAGVAEQWDTLRASMFGEGVRSAALEQAALFPQAVAVDVGAGTGFIAQGLAPRVAQVHVVDYSPEMLAVARRNLAEYSNVEFHLANGATLPLSDSSADAVLANMYLHHAPDPQVAIREMTRLLKPGGRLVITDLDQHTHTWLQDEQGDLWLGFRRQQVFEWFQDSGLVNVRVEDTQQRCSSQSEDKGDSASIEIFIAIGTRPQPEMQTAVADRYRQAATGLSGCCSPKSTAADTPASPDSISLDVLQPTESACCSTMPLVETDAELSLGCGNPLALAALQPGQVVLDLGSGAGADVFPAARRVEPGGKVIGLDMLEEMLARARATAERAGYTNVEFRQGDAQHIPLEDACVDVVISNCVLNLVQDKGQAFREAYRVLKPGGRLSISDIVTDRPFNPTLRADPKAWSACVSGALPEVEYLALVAQSGFDDIQAVRSQDWPAEDGTRVYSLNLAARKPS